MKFINLGVRNFRWDFFEEVPEPDDKVKTRRSPSYLDTAKKHKPRTKNTKSPGIK